MAPFLATYVGSTPVCVWSVFRRLRPAAAGFAIAFVWLATTGMAIAAPAASTWSLLPHPADMPLAPSGVVKMVDGALVAVSGADREQVQPIADRFMQSVANTRGLQLRMADTADAEPILRVPETLALLADSVLDGNAHVFERDLDVLSSRPGLDPLLDELDENSFAHGSFFASVSIRLWKRSCASPTMPCGAWMLWPNSSGSAYGRLFTR